MHGMKKRFLCISAVVALLFGGCSPNNQPTPSGTVSGNPFEEHQENQEGVLRMTHGAVEPIRKKVCSSMTGILFILPICCRMKAQKPNGALLFM